jgi:hypothetical protein
MMLGTIIGAIAGLLIEETTDLSPAPFVAVIGVFTGVSVMMLGRGRRVTPANPPPTVPECVPNSIPSPDRHIDLPQSARHGG